MDPNKEYQIIIESINQVKEDINLDSNSINSEADIQYRLFYYIANALNLEEEGYFRRATGEYQAYVKKKQGFNYAKKLAEKKRYISHFTFIDEGKHDKKFHDRISIQGKYDLAVLDKDFKKAKHVVEIKYQNEEAIYPKETTCYKTLEDLYAITDFIKLDKYRSNKIDPFCMGYNLICIYHSGKERDREYFTKISNYLIELKKAYENANIDYLVVLLDEDLKKAAKKESVVLNDMIKLGKV